MRTGLTQSASGSTLASTSTLLITRNDSPAKAGPRRCVVTKPFPVWLVSMVGFLSIACGYEATDPDPARTAGPSLSATTLTESSVFPIDLVFFVPCANGGAGEDVALSGSLHDLFHVTTDGSGGVHVKSHDNPQGVLGTGLTTGQKYQGTGVTQNQFNLKVGEQSTAINNFRIIGAGPGNNALVHDNFHVTVNANGVVTSFHDHFSVECR
jgi:hypothetical protein